MLDRPDYATRWQRRLQRYADQGVLPAEAGGGTNGVLF